MLKLEFIEGNLRNGLRLTAFDGTNYRREHHYDKYTRADESSVIVRHVPIVIEEGDDRDQKLFSSSPRKSSFPRILSTHGKVYNASQASSVPPLEYSEREQQTSTKIPLDLKSDKRNKRKQSNNRPENYNIRGEYFVKSELSPSADCPLHGWAGAVNNRHVKQGYKTWDRMSAIDPNKVLVKCSSRFLFIFSSLL